MGLTPEADAAVAAPPGLDVDPRSVVEHGPTIAVRASTPLARLPDVLGGPAARPGKRDELVARRRPLGRAKLDQVLDEESAPVEEANPSAVGKLEVHRVGVLEPADVEVVAPKALADLVLLVVPEEVDQRRRRVEG